MGGAERAPNSCIGVEAEPELVAARVFDDLGAVGAEIGAGGAEEYGFAHGAAA